MSNLRRLIRQEVQSREQLIVGTTLADPFYNVFDTATNPPHPRWITDVNIGSNTPLFNVPVKAGANGSRSYAKLGSAVLLKRNAQGRFEVIGPGDRVAGFVIKKTYTFGNATAVTSATEGFTFRRETFEFYEGTGAPNSLWNDGVTPFPKTTIIDSFGNPI